MVSDESLLELGGKKWRAKLVATGLDLTLLVSKGNKEEQADLRRLDVKNEIEQRTAEVEALRADREAIGAQLEQVHRLPFLFRSVITYTPF